MDRYPTSTVVPVVFAAIVSACSGTTSQDEPVDALTADDTSEPHDSSSPRPDAREADADAIGIDAIGTDTLGADGLGVDTRAADDTATTKETAPATRHVKTVFVIVMENHDWSQITGSSSAPYINGTLLKAGASTKQYYNPPGNHPSEPNYIWMVAGDNLGLTSDDDPSSANHSTSHDHLAAQLEAKGVTWRTYQQGISGTECPLESVDHYGAKHNPFVFFDDVTDGLKLTSAHCIAHHRPYTELAGDLAAGKVAQYDFIVPDECHDMHGDSSCPTTNTIKAGDDFLAAEVPKILASPQYLDDGALFITWDEADTDDGPIGMIVLSPLAKPGGYTTSIHYDHSSFLRTVEEVFGLPFLRGAKTATSLSDLFTSFP